MEEDRNGLPTHIHIQDNKIRCLQSTIQAQLENFEKEMPETTFLESSVCDNVRCQILNFNDESHLSKTQNNCRRIYIASELFIGVCSIYSHIVDYEFTQIISNMVQWEKYRQLSKKISYKFQLEAKREKYFANEAQSKFLKNLGESRKIERATTVCEDLSRPDSGLTEQVPRTLENIEHVSKHSKDKTEMLESMDDAIQQSIFTKDVEQVLQIADGLEYMQRLSEDKEQIFRPVESSETEFMTRYEKENLAVHSKIDPIEATVEEPSTKVINETLALALEASFREDSIPNIIGNLTEIRAEPSVDTSKLQYPISVTSLEELSLQKTLAEISLAEPNIQQKSENDINQILQILEEQIFQTDVGKIAQPEHTLEALETTAEAPERITIEKSPNVHEPQSAVSEKISSEEWSLPSLEHTDHLPKRHRRLIIDKTTIIPEYAARALQLNRNTNVERIQVFEGPPKILQAISANHLMTTPGFKSSLFQDIRGSKLSRLYSRHLEIEKRPVEVTVLQRRTIEKQKEVDISKEITSMEITKRVGMRPSFEKGDVLQEMPQKTRPENLVEISATGALPKESLIGTPVSRIINPIVDTLGEAQMERINTAPILPSPRAQPLQGKSLDPKTSPPWFFSTRESPPDAKYREFNYVYKKLQNYWSLFESQGMEKCITLREFFSFEQDRNVANFLTVLRVVDKLSIQRKLVLEHKSHDVFIRPFESPYVSDKQLFFKGKESVF